MYIYKIYFFWSSPSFPSSIWLIKFAAADADADANAAADSDAHAHADAKSAAAANDVSF